MPLIIPIGESGKATCMICYCDFEYISDGKTIPAACPRCPHLAFLYAGVLAPGRELDSIVASVVMDWTELSLNRLAMKVGAPCLVGKRTFDSEVEDVPFYSTDMTAAWEIVTRLYSAGFSIRLNNQIPISLGVSWRVEWWRGKINDYLWQDTGPHAICLAGLQLARYLYPEQDDTDASNPSPPNSGTSGV